MAFFYYKIFSYIFKQIKIPSLTVAKESRAHKRRNYAIYELLFSFNICLAYGLFVFSIFIKIFTKTSLSAPGEYDFVMKHKLLTVLLVILGLFILLFLYDVFSYFNIPIIS